jgi:glucose/mannose transport system substrate-binding protein
MREQWTTAEVIAVVSLLALSGCDTQVGGEEPEETPTEIEVYAPWAAGEPAPGLDALVEEFEAAHPDLRFRNPAADAASRDEAMAELDRRLQAGDAPDSFMGAAGAGMSRFIEDGRIRSLDEFYAEHDLQDAYPEQLLEQLAYRGPASAGDEEDEANAEQDDDEPQEEETSYYSVPVSVHRSNLLWYNPEVLEEANIPGAMSTLQDFIVALEAVSENTDAAPLVLGPRWTVDHLLENVLLAELGPVEYNELWGPDADWGDEAVTEALEVFEEILGYAETAGQDEGWQAAAERVAEGSGAFFIMGDWTVGHYEEMGLVAREDYGWVPTPGTDGVYLWFADAFTLPTQAPNEAGAQTWLEFVAGREGQDALNPLQGTIPARIDAEVEPYTESEYLSWALAQWQEAELAGSFWHGTSASEPWREDIDRAVAGFLDEGDLADFQDDLDDAASAGSAELQAEAEDEDQ